MTQHKNLKTRELEFLYRQKILDEYLEWNHNKEFTDKTIKQFFVWILSNKPELLEFIKSPQKWPKFEEIMTSILP